MAGFWRQKQVGRPTKKLENIFENLIFIFLLDVGIFELKTLGNVKDFGGNHFARVELFIVPSLLPGPEINDWISENDRFFIEFDLIFKDFS